MSQYQKSALALRRMRQRIFDYPQPRERQACRVLNYLKCRSLRDRDKVSSPVGLYSGLTRSELHKTGTCETDWFQYLIISPPRPRHCPGFLLRDIFLVRDIFAREKVAQNYSLAVFGAKTRAAGYFSYVIFLRKLSRYIFNAQKYHDDIFITT